MSQGLFNAMFMGPKESKAARKVIKFVAYYGFITVTLAVAILFIPYEPLQAVISEKVANKWAIGGTVVFSYLCFFFLLKERLWAPSILLAWEVIELIFNYIDTGEFFSSSFSSVDFILYASALRATYYLTYQNTNTVSEPENQQS